MNDWIYGKLESDSEFGCNSGIVSKVNLALFDREIDRITVVKEVILLMLFSGLMRRSKSRLTSEIL